MSSAIDDQRVVGNRDNPRVSASITGFDTRGRFGGGISGASQIA